MIRKATTLLILLLIFFMELVFAQDNTIGLEQILQEKGIEPKVTDYGLFYEVLENNTNSKPKLGDYIAIQFEGQLIDGTVFDTSDPKEPFVFQVGHRQVIRGLDLGVRELPIGSKGRLYIPPNLGYGIRGAGEKVPPNTPLIFEVNIVKKLTDAEYDKYMIELEKKEQAAYQATVEAQFLKDKKLIQEYALTKKLRTKRTVSGLSYVITKRGKGTNAKPGDELEVTYEGVLLDGRPFDATKSKETYKVVLGKGKVIKGWEEGLTYFAEGSEGILLIPSKLAYGQRAIYEKEVAVPANSVLIFNIKVDKIKRGELN